MLLTTAQLSSVVVLTVVIPLVVRVLRPLYKREMSASAVAIEAQDDETVTEATDHLDVHLAFASWVIEAFGYILVTFMTTHSTVLAGTSEARGPFLPFPTCLLASFLFSSRGFRWVLCRTIAGFPESGGCFRGPAETGYVDFPTMMMIRV